ncbi:MAG: PAS domain-containing protein [Phycisphaerae bacterium]
MTRLMVTANALGVPTALVPLPLLWYLARRFPTKKIVTAYDHATNQVLVDFPGWEAPAVQYMLDELSTPPTSRYADLATWPGQRSDRHENPRACAERRVALEAAWFDPESDAECLETPESGVELDSWADPCRDLRNPTTGSVLAELRTLMTGLTTRQQDQLTDLVGDLKSTLAAERLCFHQLFEAAPDGYAATDLEGNIQHANQALYQWLQVDAPRLDGMPLLMFFTPGSKTLVGQCLKLLSAGDAECQAYADIRAQITLSDDHEMSVSMRLIAIKAPDSAYSTVRWLIRDLT